MVNINLLHQHTQEKLREVQAQHSKNIYNFDVSRALLTACGGFLELVVSILPMAIGGSGGYNVTWVIVCVILSDLFTTMVSQ